MSEWVSVIVVGAVGGVDDLGDGDVDLWVCGCVCMFVSTLVST